MPARLRLAELAVAGEVVVVLERVEVHQLLTNGDTSSTTTPTPIAIQPICL